ncbi:hypothetical protein B0J18DRAFT_439272 [Chaetomium sp. MPI-SDFR-AT-0129]|uniref:Uncharacterized protein n=1 Tax=Dichotomopilus funicola TaxID=1934379 RepID=A0AAN6UYP4_9PEZI|nr:hypothetical protein B0J18DRAFT_439272 [Chaetomium sp. MPI-SDFR-AT-0129]KAK4141464.1 hypothetical protein C8A04DRAFT_30963 [Dichotomopilus funicola]
MQFTATATAFAALFATALAQVTVTLPSGVSLPSGITLPSGVSVATAGATSSAAANRRYRPRQNIGGGISGISAISGISLNLAVPTAGNS